MSFLEDRASCSALFLGLGFEEWEWDALSDRFIKRTCLAESHWAADILMLLVTNMVQTKNHNSRPVAGRSEANMYLDFHREHAYRRAWESSSSMYHIHSVKTRLKQLRKYDELGCALFTFHACTQGHKDCDHLNDITICTGQSVG